MDNANDLINDIISGNFVEPPPTQAQTKVEPEVRRLTADELVDLMLFELGIGVSDE